MLGKVIADRVMMAGVMLQSLIAQSLMLPAPIVKCGCGVKNYTPTDPARFGGSVSII